MVSIVQQEYSASPTSDYSLQILLDSLNADTTYYYRFSCHNQVSITGRTRTAPGSGSTSGIRFALVSCQERQHGFNNAYRNLLDSEHNAEDENSVRFILHLGDLIYEACNDPLQVPLVLIICR